MNIKMSDLIKIILFLILAILTFTIKEQTTLVVIIRFACFFMVGWYFGGILKIKTEK
jgi:ABC-type bacteriocin/lantibiotic exporter with double-glycine peptidase domain